MLHGYRRNITGYARTLEEFDHWLGNFIPKVAQDEHVSVVSRAQLSRWLADGTAWKKFLVCAQDDDASALEKMEVIHRAPIIHPLLTPVSGTVKKLDAETIERASVFLGADRQRSDDAIDFAVGLSQIKKVGERVKPHEPVLFVHARTNYALASVLPLLEKAIVIA